MREDQRPSGPVEKSLAVKPETYPSKASVHDTLAAQAVSLGLTPIRAFVVPADTMSPGASPTSAERAAAKTTSASRAANARAAWRARGFNQLVLVVPDSENIRSAFRSIEDSLKNGASWPDALCRDPAMASLVLANEELSHQLSTAQTDLEKCRHEVAQALVGVKPSSLIAISRAGFSAAGAIVASIFLRRRYEAK